MANDAVLQVRIDSHLKSEVEQLYRQMGMSFSEAVRLFARQSLLKRRLPFEVSDAAMDSASMKQLRFVAVDDAEGGPASAFAMLADYADDGKRAREKEAWLEVAAAKAAKEMKQGDGVDVSPAPRSGALS